MRIVLTALEMSNVSREFRDDGASIGFVPTMGALHSGHKSLINDARSRCSKVVVSVFVNPTQFNNNSDLLSYPRTFDQDKELLNSLGVDVMFFPSTEEVYPGTESVQYELDGLDARMEGPNRPGHFNGVVQVVTRLFDLVAPDQAFFGEKDFQQLAIIRHMTKKLGYPVDIIGCKTVRESTGLAMSSRNVRLSSEGLVRAELLSKCLFQLKSSLKRLSLKDSIDISLEMFRSQPQIQLEYLELVDPDTLLQANEQSGSVQACIAATVEGVRLIDNMRVK